MMSSPVPTDPLSGASQHYDPVPVQVHSPYHHPDYASAGNADSGYQNSASVSSDQQSQGQHGATQHSATQHSTGHLAPPQTPAQASLPQSPGLAPTVSPPTLSSPTLSAVHDEIITRSRNPGRPTYDSLVPHSHAQLSFPEPDFARQPYRLATSTMLCMGTIAIAMLIAPVLSSQFAGLVLGGLAYEAATLLAAFACYVVSQRVQGQAKFVWSMGALAAAAASLAQLSWVATLLSTGAAPSADAPWRTGMLVAYPPVLLALFFLTVGLGRWTAMLRRVSDCVLIAGSVLVTTWGVTSAAIRNQSEQRGQAVWGWVLAADLAGSLLCLTLVAVVIAHRGVWRDKVGMVVLGIAVIAGVGGMQSVSLLAGWNTDQWGFQAGLTLGMLLVAAGAFGVQGPEATAEEPNPSLLALMLPYGCLLLAMGCLVTQRLMGKPPQVGESLITLLLVVAVLLRHMLTATETHRLLSALANREQVMRHQALHDPLTGLANRALFTDRVEHAVTMHARSGQGVVVLFCDLDDFKEVNDSLGHAAGDALLVAIAARMREVVRAGDTVARLGGDEFALLVEQPDADVTDIARRLLLAISAPLNLTQAWVFPSASIGSAYLPPAGPTTRTTTTVTRLLGDADEAMYVAKASGKGRHAGAVNGHIALTAHVGLPYDPLNVELPLDAAPVSEDPTVPNRVPPGFGAPSPAQGIW